VGMLTHKRRRAGRFVAFTRDERGASDSRLFVEHRD